MTLDEPLLVVELGPFEKGQAQLLDAREAPDPQQLLLERTDHPLGAAVALRGPDEREARFDPQERQFSALLVGSYPASMECPEKS